MGGKYCHAQITCKNGEYSINSRTYDTPSTTLQAFIGMLSSEDAKGLKQNCHLTKGICKVQGVLRPPWYHGRVSRSAAEALLQASTLPDAFLVRDPHILLLNNRNNKKS